RILALERSGAPAPDAAVPGQAGGGGRRLAAALGLVAVLMAASVAGYLWLGAPGYQDMPLQGRIAAAQQAMENRPAQADAEAEATPPRPETVDPEHLALVERLRAALEERPDDLRGHELLARHETQLGNYRAAYAAQRRVIELRGDDATADDYAFLADLMVLAAGGYVSPEAETALEAALRRDPRNGTAQYYLGLMLAQGGRPDLAFSTWRDLHDRSDPDDPWMAPIRARLESLAQRAGVRYTLPPLRDGGGAGPSAEALAEAEDMAPEEREEMVRGMVQRLARRLDAQGGSPDEWAQLITAYGVLGRTDMAQDTWGRAQRAYIGRPDALEVLRTAAREAGLTDQSGQSGQ
ncbi:c-type cytochrome biogenesis protein CcmI, partial [Rhodobacteraceae bacterium WD3A24]